jgi:hypothetical protein
MTSDSDEEIARMVTILRRIGAQEVLVVGKTPLVLVQHVSALYTERIVMTGERYRHVTERHPELIGCEHLIIEAVRDPDAIHRNERDPNTLVLYRTDTNGTTIRVALWISDEDGRSNSIHSARFAHAQEQDRGTRRGKVIWRRN